MTLAAAGKSVECCVAGTGTSPLGSRSYLNFTEPWKVGLKAPFKHKTPSALAEAASTPVPTYLGSTELSGLAFGGDGTLGSATALPEDPCRASGTGPGGGGGGFGSISLAEVRRCSFTSFSRDLALCSAKRRSNCFFRPGTALRWLSEWVYGEERGEAQPL